MSEPKNSDVLAAIKAGADADEVYRKISTEWRQRHEKEHASIVRRLEKNEEFRLQFEGATSLVAGAGKVMGILVVLEQSLPLF